MSRLDEIFTNMKLLDESVFSWNQKKVPDNYPLYDWRSVRKLHYGAAGIQDFDNIVEENWKQRKKKEEEIMKEMSEIHLKHKITFNELLDKYFTSIADIYKRKTDIYTLGQYGTDTLLNLIKHSGNDGDYFTYTEVVDGIINEYIITDTSAMIESIAKLPEYDHVRFHRAYFVDCPQFHVGDVVKYYVEPSTARKLPNTELLEVLNDDEIKVKVLRKLWEKQYIEAKEGIIMAVDCRMNPETKQYGFVYNVAYNSDKDVSSGVAIDVKEAHIYRKDAKVFDDQDELFNDWLKSNYPDLYERIQIK